MMPRPPIVLTILLVGAAPAATRGADEPAPAAVLVGGESFPASLEKIEPDATFRFTTPAGGRAVEAARLVRWGNPAEPKSGRLIVLADGSHLAAVEWAVRPRQQPLVLDDAALTFAPSLFEPITVPRQLVHGVLLQLPADSARRDGLLEQVRSHSEQHDAVLLAEGDLQTGNITKWNGDAISLRTSLGDVQIPLSQATAALFAFLNSDPLQESSPLLLVGLSDGSLLVVRELVQDGDNLRFQLGSGIELRGATVKDVVSLQPLGGTVTYLSDIEPHRYVHVPYLDLQWPLGRDQNDLGGRLRAGGRLFSKGLGVHTAARLIYRLNGSQERFAAQLAIDDAAGRGGSALFRVLLAEEDAWREAYTSPVIRGGDDPLPVSVPLGEARGLALVVDYAERGDELDHADWLDARLE